MGFSNVPANLFPAATEAEVLSRECSSETVIFRVQWAILMAFVLLAAIPASTFSFAWFICHDFRGRDHSFAVPMGREVRFECCANRLAGYASNRQNASFWLVP